MAEPEIRYLGDVQRLALKPGDMVVLQCPGTVTDEVGTQISEYMARLIPGHKVIVLGDGMKIGLIGQED